MESAVWGLIGTIVGALASIGTTWISGQSASNLQKQASSLERMEKGRAFQRDTLVELQDALNDALRMMARTFFEDCESFKQSGNWDWGKSFLSEEVSEEVRLANRRMSILIERIADDQLRFELKEIMKMSVQVSFAKSHNEAEAICHLASTTAYNNVMAHLGNVLRSLY
jgi:hypothetical protein